jgi:hypothetical protein
MKAFFFCVVLLLVIPMAVLNPMGRPAFLGYYTGVIATIIGLRLAGSVSTAWDQATHWISH